MSTLLLVVLVASANEVGESSVNFHSEIDRALLSLEDNVGNIFHSSDTGPLRFNREVIKDKTSKDKLYVETLGCSVDAWMSGYYAGNIHQFAWSTLGQSVVESTGLGTLHRLDKSWSVHSGPPELANRGGFYSNQHQMIGFGGLTLEENTFVYGRFTRVVGTTGFYVLMGVICPSDVNTVESMEGWFSDSLSRVADRQSDTHNLDTLEINLPDLDPEDVAMKFLRVPSGQFTMGCLPGRDDVTVPNGNGTYSTVDCNSPLWGAGAHTVELTQDLWVQETELTNAQWLSLVHYPTGIYILSEYSNPNYPQGASWHTAAMYANLLSEQEGLESCYSCGQPYNFAHFMDPSWLYSEPCRLEVNPYSCEGYRLPTEAEWEYAARAGTENVWSGTSNHGDLYLYAAYWDWDLQIHEPIPERVGVKDKLPNNFGLYGMTGNAWEWTNDWASWDTLTNNRRPHSTEYAVNPTGPQEREYWENRGIPGWHSDRQHYPYRIIKGGSTQEDYYSSTISYRGSDQDVAGYHLFGFRLVRSILE